MTDDPFTDAAAQVFFDAFFGPEVLLVRVIGYDEDGHPVMESEELPALLAVWLLANDPRNGSEILSAHIYANDSGVDLGDWDRSA